MPARFRRGWRRCRRGCCRSVRSTPTTPARCTSGSAPLPADLDDRNEKLGDRIREAQVKKVPYMLVCGERERAAGTVSLRHRTGDDLGAVALDRVVTDLSREIAVRAPDLTVGRS